VIPVRKLCFFLMLTTIVSFAALEKLRSSIQEYGLTARSSPHYIKPLRTNSNIPPAVSVPVPSTNVKDLAPGKLLVATRSLVDPHFARTVVLLIHYKEKSLASGLIVNRRTDVPLSRMAKGLSGNFYLGGPVEPDGTFALLKTPAKLDGGEHIFDGVNLIISLTLFQQIISGQPDPSVFHVYQGCAEWSPDQLEMEVRMGDWFIFPESADAVFSADPDSMWSQMIQTTKVDIAGSEATNIGRAQEKQTRSLTRGITRSDGYKKLPTPGLM
jgi:putative transcriptional regulator